MEALEFGDLLMRRRPRLEALAVTLVEDRQSAGRAVRRVLSETWRARDLLGSETEMDRYLDNRLRCALRPDEADVVARTLTPTGLGSPQR